MMWLKNMETFPAMMPRDFVFPWRSLFYETLKKLSPHRNDEDSMTILKQCVEYSLLQGEHYYETTLALSLIIDNFLDTDLDEAIKAVSCAFKINSNSKYLERLQDYLIEVEQQSLPISNVKSWLNEKGKKYGELAKYFITSLEEELTYEANYTYSPQLLYKIVTKILKRRKMLGEAKFAIYGTGGHTETLLTMCNTNSMELKCFFKSLPQKNEQFQNLPVFSPNNIKEIDLDFVLISSAPYEKEIYHMLQSNGVHQYCSIQPIYGSLEALEIKGWGGRASL
jgi:hypothetical protein